MRHLRCSRDIRDLLKELLYVNFLSQWGHDSGFCPSCASRCWLKACLPENSALHFWHWKGLSTSVSS